VRHVTPGNLASSSPGVRQTLLTVVQVRALDSGLAGPTGGWIRGKMMNAATKARAPNTKLLERTANGQPGLIGQLSAALRELA
jgi:hypothetical protein